MPRYVLVNDDSTVYPAVVPGFVVSGKGGDTGINVFGSLDEAVMLRDVARANSENPNINVYRLELEGE